MKRFLSTFLVFIAFTLSFAQTNQYPTYKSHDLKKVLVANNDGYFFDMKYVDEIITNINTHAGEYPTKFNTNEEKTQAIKDVNVLAGLLNTYYEMNSDINILKRIAHVYVMSHNLDIPNAADNAISLYEKILKAEPENGFNSYKFGTFLASIGALDDALKHLQKANSLGVKQSLFSLGLVYLSKDDSKKAVSYLEEYIKSFPKDENAKNLISAIKSGNIKIQKVE